jgi:hypothetical protein
MVASLQLLLLLCQADFGNCGLSRTTINPKELPLSGARIERVQDPSVEHRWPTEQVLVLAGRNLRDRLLQILQSVEAGFAWIDEHRDEIRAFWERAKDDDRHGEWGYLVSRVDAFTGIGVRLALEMRRSFNSVSPDQLDEPLAEIISRGLTEPGTVEAVLESVERAPCPRSRSSS